MKEQKEGNTEDNEKGQDDTKLTGKDDNTGMTGKDDTDTTGKDDTDMTGMGGDKDGETDEDEKGPITGRPEDQTQDEYKNDPNFQAIDEKLRAENDLDGYDVASVSRQLVNGYIYVIIYRKPDGTSKTFRVLVTPQNQIQVLSSPRAP